MKHLLNSEEAGQIKKNPVTDQAVVDDGSIKGLDQLIWMRLNLGLGLSTSTPQRIH